MISEFDLEDSFQRGIHFQYWPSIYYKLLSVKCAPPSLPLIYRSHEKTRRTLTYLVSFTLSNLNLRLENSQNSVPRTYC